MIDTHTQEVCDLIKGRMNEGERTIVAIAGPPASGKSTLAEAVVQNLNATPNAAPPRATLLPMDGYHLDNRLLETRGSLARKGSPETFNSRGFCDAVKRLKNAGRETFHPRFDRQMDISIAQAIAIDPNTPIVVVEGNYLLLDAEPWKSIHNVYSASIFVCPPVDELKERLVRRWIKHGFGPDAALARAKQNDLPNADLVMRQSVSADLQLRSKTAANATY